MLAFENFQRQHLFNQFENQQQAPYPGLDMDSYEPFDNMNGFNTMPFSYYESQAMFVSAPSQPMKQDLSRTTSSGSIQTYQQHQHEMPPALISSHSIPSASSSTVGSPYSGPLHTITNHESYVTDLSNSLASYPTIVSQEGYAHDFVTSNFDTDLSMGHDKLTSDFVGESADLSSVKTRSSTFSIAVSQPPSFSSSTSHRASPDLLSPNKTDNGGLPTSTSITRTSSLPAHVATSTSTPTVFKSPTTPASAYPKSHSANSPIDVRRSPHGAQNHTSPVSNVQAFSNNSSPMQQYANQLHNPFFAQSSGSFMPPLESSYPSLISAPRSFGDFCEQPLFPQNLQPFPHISPAASPAPSSQHYPVFHKTQFSPPVTHDNFSQHQTFMSRRPSISSYHSGSHSSPSSDFNEDGEKGRCPHPDCGKVFKDLKAHMLTHQAERPEKCPIINCEYNQKGFARKYDKNRHTLTHYKGTMVCGFCPGSGSAAEKSFNRADVFKRHLTSVHGVEQAPPNSRKRSPTASTRKLSSYCQDATGKCSTCSATFSNAQDFYEHLDDCVLRVVQQEEPSEAINAQHLGSMTGDAGVQDTLERHMIKSEDTATSMEDDEEDDDEDDEDEDPSFSNRSGKGCIKVNKAAGAARAVIGGGISKPTKNGKKGMTWSSGGVPLVGKGRKKRKHYPPSWGMSAEKMQMKKRVLCVYDGERRLWKDDMMLHNEYEVRMKLPDGNSYVTDLDVETLKRAEAFHNATEAERGPWMPQDDGLQEFDLNELMS